MNVGKAGASGRRKIALVDYNGDGRVDLLANGRNADLYLQAKAENGNYYFVAAGEIDALPIRGHSTSPTVVDFNGDGVLDPLVGAEDGHFYYKRNDWEAGRRGRAVFVSDSLTVETSLKTAKLENGGKAFENRDYVWFDLAPELKGREFVRTFGGSPVDVVLKAKKDVRVEFLVGTTCPTPGISSVFGGPEQKKIGAK